MLSFGNRSSLLACNTLIKRVGVYRFSRGGDAGHHQTSSLILSNGSCTFRRHYSIPTSSTSTELNSFLDTLFKKKKTNTSFFSDLLAVEDDSGHSSNWTLTQNGSLAYKSSGSALVDFFYKSVEGISQRGIHQLLSESWQEDPTRTLKVIFFILDIRQGKGEKKIFYECQRWLALHHPKTFLANLKFISKFGYWKDLLNLLSYIRYGGYEMDERPRWFQRQQNHLSRLPSVFGLKQFLRYLKRCSYNKTEDKDHISEELTEMDILRHMKNISESRELMEFSAQEKIILRQSYLQAREIIVDLYVDQLRKDKEYMIKKSQAQPSQPVGIHSLCAKWAPSIGRSADKLLDGIGLDIAKKLFPLDEQVYEYLAKIKYQKEYLAPLRAATPVIETFMAAKRWSEIPYQRVPSVCMHRNKKLFMRRDLERFSEFLGKVVKGEQKISGKVLFPHQIVENLMVEKDKNAILTLELQWKTLVENTEHKETLS
ncbi:hypothetical protein C9374_004347 [Naegleria lovaniensis]|uniref:DUF2828 domain-containing protein n=1 Tax=Naegleria lovaniensis TaxID=51637 RepID=A0AA88KPE8_NAELO|nr:uncharacterized protein C9374_004347 [Naegleria lovaniensis]KAG2383676.1 hypothetical protein C9374_004347 [Naegleria lovaniensis]